MLLELLNLHNLSLLKEYVEEGWFEHVTKSFYFLPPPKFKLFGRYLNGQFGKVISLPEILSKYQNKMPPQTNTKKVLRWSTGTDYQKVLAGASRLTRQFGVKNSLHIAIKAAKDIGVRDNKPKWGTNLFLGKRDWASVFDTQLRAYSKLKFKAPKYFYRHVLFQKFRHKVLRRF